jgi:hypothetical protein
VEEERGGTHGVGTRNIIGVYALLFPRTRERRQKSVELDTSRKLRREGELRVHC